MKEEILETGKTFLSNGLQGKRKESNEHNSLIFSLPRMTS
jgi:hypothetical protein